MPPPKDPEKYALYIKRQKESHTGHRPSKETRERMKISHMGKKRGEEFCKRASEVKVGNKNPMFGKRGENAPAWKGGISFSPYCPKFNKRFKERVREFFDHKCALCGERIEYKLDIHHVDYNKQTCCDGSKPLFVALCRSCHTKTNHNREYWEAYLIGNVKLFNA